MEAFAEKFRDPRIANMLKVRAKTLIEYKEVGCCTGQSMGVLFASTKREKLWKRIFFWDVSSPQGNVVEMIVWTVLPLTLVLFSTMTFVLSVAEWQAGDFFMSKRPLEVSKAAAT